MKANKMGEGGEIMMKQGTLHLFQARIAFGFVIPSGMFDHPDSFPAFPTPKSTLSLYKSHYQHQSFFHFLFFLSNKHFSIHIVVIR